MDVLCVFQEEMESMGLSMSRVIETVEDCWLAEDRASVPGFTPYRGMNLPYASGVLCLNDHEGSPKAILDADSVLAYRAGATTGLVTKHMAPDNSEVASIIGLGLQGRANLQALEAVLPKLRRVQIHDICEERVTAYMEAMGKMFPRLDFVPSFTVKEAVQGADVIVSCTPIRDIPHRFVFGDWLKKDALTIAVDYDSAFDAEVMRQAQTFICDDQWKYLLTQKQGTFFQKGYPGEEHIYADMAEICSGLKEPVREGGRAAILTGVGCHDILTAELLFEEASQQGLGTYLDL